MSFERSLPDILRYEVGYVNNPNDHGGRTNKGITQVTYDRWRDSQHLLCQSVRLTDTEGAGYRASGRT